MNTVKRLLEAILKRPLANEIFFYLIFGVLTTVIGFGTYALFLYLNLSVALSNTLSHILAILFAYVTNKIWVFKALDFTPGAIVKEFIKFASGRFASYVVDTVLLIVLVDWLLYDALWSKVFTSVIVVILNYVFSKAIAFRKPKSE